MAVDYFLKIEGIEGESEDDKHKNEIELSSFTWSELQSGSFAQGGGGSGKVQMKNFEFSSPVSKASPKLLLACATGQHISGVGKTETAMALAETLYGGDRNMVVVNTSEYKGEHKISRLTGSAAGYVGCGEGGVLTEAVRRKPYSVVLLDEAEKAHPSVQEVFYQVFDKGMLQDDKGQEIDFRNTIVLLTTNAASDAVMGLCADPDTCPDAAGLASAIHDELLKTFKPALLGRMSAVPYYPLGDEVLRKIVAMQFARIARRVADNHDATFTYDDVVATITDRCKEVETGARNADHIITGTILPEISKQVLSHLAAGEPIHSIHVSCNPDKTFCYKVE